MLNKHQLCAASVVAATTMMMLAIPPVMLSTAAASAAGVQPNLIGGHAATDRDEFITSVQFDAPTVGLVNQHICGGTLVAPNEIVTAAHCVTDPPSGLTGQQRHAIAQRYRLDADAFTVPPVKNRQYHVRVGSRDRTNGGEQASVVRISVHPKWNWEATPNTEVADIAVLKLDRAVDAQPIEVADHAGEPGSAIRELGWGIANPDMTRALPKRLQELDTTIAEPALCVRGGTDQGPVGDMCLNNVRRNFGPCFGDSGSPAIALNLDTERWEFVGITSRGGDVPCGTGPATYTDATFYLDWLYEVMRQPAGLVSSAAAS